MAKKQSKKVTVRTVTSLPKKSVGSKKTKTKSDDNRTKTKGRVSSKGNKVTVNKRINSKSTQIAIRSTRKKSEAKNNTSTRPVPKTNKPKRVTASEIEYNKEGLSKLRKTVRKADGTYFKKSYYEKLLKKVQGKSRDEVDDELIRLRNANPNVRYYAESKAQTLHWQTGNFVDRLAGKVETVGVRKGKRKGETKVTGKIKKGTSVTITDLRGDEHSAKTVAQATDLLRRQNTAINRVIDRLRTDAVRAAKDERTKEKLKKKQKGVGVYVTIPEKVTSNSEGEVVSISYDFSQLEVQGIERMKFDMMLEDELENDTEI